MPRTLAREPRGLAAARPASSRSERAQARRQRGSPVPARPSQPLPNEAAGPAARAQLTVGWRSVTFLDHPSDTTFPGTRPPPARPGPPQPAKTTLAQSGCSRVVQTGVGIGWASEALFLPRFRFRSPGCVALVWYLEHRCPAYSGRPRDSLSGPPCVAIRVVINFLFPMFSLLDFSSAAFSSPRQMDFVAEGKAAWTEEPGQVAGRRALEEEAPPASSCCGKMRLAGQRLRPGHPGPPEQSLPLPPPDPRDLEEPTSAEGPVKCGFREARAPSPCPAKFTSASRKKGIVEMAHQGHRVSDGEARGPRPPEKASWAGVGGTG